MSSTCNLRALLALCKAPARKMPRVACPSLDVLRPIERKERQIVNDPEDLAECHSRMALCLAKTTEREKCEKE